MSKYGFDLDGTLDNPNITQLARDLYEAGHSIYVISAAHMDTPTTEEKVQKLKDMGMDYTELIVVRDKNVDRLGLNKGVECERLGISVFFEDDAQYAYDIHAVSPDTTSLMIYK